jgi:hypothetical protein
MVGCEGNGNEEIKHAGAVSDYLIKVITAGELLFRKPYMHSGGGRGDPMVPP